MTRKDIESEKIPLTEESQEQKVSLLQSSTAKIEDEVTEANSDDEVELVKASRFSPPLNPLLQEIQNNRIFNKQRSLLSEDKLKDLAESGGVTGLEPTMASATASLTASATASPLPPPLSPPNVGFEPGSLKEEDDLPPPPPTPPLDENPPPPLLNGDHSSENNASDSEIIPSPPPPQDFSNPQDTIV
jgi:hypothetical protein